MHTHIPLVKCKWYRWKGPEGRLAGRACRLLIAQQLRLHLLPLSAQSDQSETGPCPPLYQHCSLLALPSSFP